MKVHLLWQDRVACHHTMPELATMTVSPRLVTCLRCRATKYFKIVRSAKKHRAKQDFSQLELFDDETSFESTAGVPGNGAEWDRADTGREVPEASHTIESHPVVLH